MVYVDSLYLGMCAVFLGRSITSLSQRGEEGVAGNLQTLQLLKNVVTM